MPAQQGGIVGNGTSGSIENQATAGQSVKKRLVAHVPCGPLAVVGEWRVIGDDIAALLQLGQGGENDIKRTVPIFTRGVVEEGGEAKLGGPAGNDGADVADADDAQCEAVGGSNAAGLHPGMDGAEYPLGDSGSVASWGVAHGNAVGVAIIEVDVVGADGR